MKVGKWRLISVKSIVSGYDEPTTPLLRRASGYGRIGPRRRWSQHLVVQANE